MQVQSYHIQYQSSVQDSEYALCAFGQSINSVRPKGNRDGRTSYVVGLDYGSGFERYGGYEGWYSGWDVRVPGESGSPPSKNVGHARVYNLPKALLLKEARTGMKTAGDALVRLLRWETNKQD